MKKLAFAAFLMSGQCLAQNVGIGTTTPTGPLSFGNNLGNKVIFYGDGNSDHYGIGLQSGLLQMYSDAMFADIAFGYGRSNAFNERVRIINAGIEAMTVRGRVSILNATPENPDAGSGIWLYKPDNSGQLGFVGTHNSQNIGFYGGPGGWGFTYDAINSRVGIGNHNPNAPLAFAPSLNKKITLYPGATGDVGFGVAGNRLQIYSDNPSADVAIGYDILNIGFQERFAFKPNGALALQGNAGSAGQVLTSNGAGAGVSWSPIAVQAANGATTGGITTSVGGQEITGSSVTLTISRRSRLFYSANFTGVGPDCALCSEGGASIFLRVNGNNVLNNVYYLYAANRANSRGSANIANFWIDLDPGTHSIASFAFTVVGLQPISSLLANQSSIIAIPL